MVASIRPRRVSRLSRAMTAVAITAMAGGAVLLGFELLAAGRRKRHWNNHRPKGWSAVMDGWPAWLMPKRGQPLTNIRSPRPPPSWPPGERSSRSGRLQRPDRAPPVDPYGHSAGKPTTARESTRKSELPEHVFIQLAADGAGLLRRSDHRNPPNWPRGRQALPGGGGSCLGARQVGDAAAGVYAEKGVCLMCRAREAGQIARDAGQSARCVRANPPAYTGGSRDANWRGPRSRCGLSIIVN